MTRSVRLRTMIKSSLPHRAWVLLGRVMGANVPDILLGSVAAAGVRTRLLFASSDADDFRRMRGQAAVESLQAHGAKLSYLEVTQSDHALLKRAGREAVIEQLYEYLREDLELSDWPVRPAQGR
jgi:hypothetical protein